MEGVLFLCDWAEVLQGKVYAQGMGWQSVKAGRRTNFSVVMLLHVPYDQTNVEHKVELALVTEDGHSYPNGNGGKGARFGLNFELGRPPGMKKGRTQVFPFAAKVNGLTFSPGGYRWEAKIGDDIVAIASFEALDLK